MAIPVPRPPDTRDETKVHDLIKEPLGEVWINLAGDEEAQKAITELLDMTKKLQNPATRRDLELRFHVLNPLRHYVVWLPTLLHEDRKQVWLLVLLAYWYSTAMTLQPIRYAPVSQLLRSSCIKPVENINSRLLRGPNLSLGETQLEYAAALRLLELPVQICADMKDQLRLHKQQMQSAALIRQ